MNDFSTLYVLLLFCSVSERPPTTPTVSKSYIQLRNIKNISKSRTGMKGLHVCVISCRFKPLTALLSHSDTHTHHEVKRCLLNNSYLLQGLYSKRTFCLYKYVCAHICVCGNLCCNCTGWLSTGEITSTLSWLNL